MAKSIFSIWTTFLLLVLAVPVAAQSELTMEQAVKNALSTNRDIVAAGFDKKAAAFGVSEAAGNYLPTVKLQEIYMESNNPVAAFGTSLNQGTFSLAEFQMSDPNEPDKAKDYITRLELEQPVFAGGKIITGIYQASKMYKAAQFTEKRQRLNVEFEVADSYYNVLRARQFVILTDMVISTMQRHRKTAWDYFQSGLALESDALQADVYLAKAQVANVESKNRSRLAMAQLNYLMGEQQSRNWELQAPVNVDCALPSLDDLLSKSLEQRQDLAAMDRKVDVAESQVFMAATGWIPTLGLKAEYNFHDEDKLFGDQAEDWTVMAAAQWEVFSGGRDISKTGAAVYQAKAAKTRLRSMKEGISLDVRQKYLTLEGQVQKLEMSSSAVKQAERNLEIMSNRFEQGLIKIADLLDAQTALTESKTNELNATYDLILARLSLHHVIGDRQCGPENSVEEIVEEGEVQ